MSSLRPLIPLLIAAGILLAGNGLQGTLIALRGAEEGFSETLIGLMGSAYFAGFLIGCLCVPRLLRAVGHIRAFAALAAMGAAGSLLLILFVDPIAWIAIRFLSGICFSSLFTTIESWLNSAASNSNRARLLAVYRIIDIGAVTGSQYMLPALGIEGFTVFAVMAMMITLSLVPVSMADRSNPKPPAEFSLNLPAVWRISPLAAFGCLSVGLTNSAFRIVGPIYGQSIGLSVSEIATFMSAGIIGGAVMQYPLGALSDRRDRRQILLGTTIGALISALIIVWFAGDDRTANMLLVFLFGAFAMSLYSLSVAHANDHAKKDQFVQLAAGLLFFYSVGAMAGPLLASLLMQRFGPHALFAYTALIYAVLIAVTIYRMRARPAVPRAHRPRFAALLRTSPVFMRMARRSRNSRPANDG
ncbi:MFS transporter [Nitratireductor aquimarinus]|uniref:MFS transporter n=1 Tax=Nitratireductor TaxID=245876 RepID=UPI0019D3AA95|nr:MULTISPECIES: MFS transporter [Nitratireductor]MBN7763428.1 MFS transporter [Nitratireductor aquibiodomus]MBN7778807.1 MFS transporter [Nitratireductor pacificus]MBN7783130.1 MFS transporter [Nitratireductor pacificus]MBN7791937.1 MFS transporter [Nitratireductor aquimarinus]MBN8241721.1 MFS transporter [Nitratireductor aquimarinus]